MKSLIKCIEKKIPTTALPKYLINRFLTQLEPKLMCDLVHMVQCTKYV